MASSILTKDEQNFIRFVKICLDVFKRPLADILASEIQPADLYNKIKQHSCSLLNGKNKLDSKQEKICFLSPPAIPDYNEFDVTLLYKLIRNLCPSLAPTKGWGKDPMDTDTQIGDDIERLRLFRNNNFHEVSSEISDNNFEIICKKLKFVFQRIQNHMASKGYKANYEENMTNIKQLNLGDEHIDKYKIAFLERTIDQLQADGMEKPKVSIKGPTNILCGNDAKFTADINPENRKGWSITWQKKVQQTSTRINTSTEKYSGSTDRSLVIRHVCKGDTGGYQAILSRDSEAKNISVSSNVIVLQAIGGPPIFEVWDVTTGVNGIRIHYRFKKRPPDVTEIKWIKDEVPILKRNKKYEGGKLNDSYFTITSPTIEDRGHYSCVVQNVVGSVQKDVQFDVPNVEISTEQEVYFGSKTSFTSRIVSCPSPDGAEWQQSNDGKTFKSIIISKPKYYGSSCDPKSPLLIIPKVTFEDKLYYRLLVWNKIGEQYSNTVFLDVKGSLPNITISHRTCVLDRSITLIGNVFLYGSLPAVKNVFWTKNGEELDTKGSGGRYSEVTVDNPSLTIFEVNEYDAGSYQLTATNAVGSTTSDFLILDVPDVSMAKPEKKNSGFWFTVTIKSIPAPDFAQWSIKEKSSDTFIPIDENAEEFEGTSNTLPHPVLVFNPKTDLEDYCFQIEVRNFIGSCIKITPGEGSSDDPFTNGNQGGLSKIYLDGGAGLKFAKLFDDIAELFPEKKTRRLKDFIQNSQNCKDITLFAETVTARDCLEILRDHKLFTPWDVIFMQYLLKNTECKELFEKCIAYGQAHGALCFYEKLPENGYKNVQFHVRGNLSCYTQVEIRKILETVADIVGCNSTEMFVNGYRHSSSFLVILSIEKKHVKKLLTMKQQEKDNLSWLNIDYFIVDFIKVYLQSPQEIRGADDNGDYPIMLQKLWGKATTLGYALFEKHSKELDPVTSDIVNAKHMTSISVSAKEVKHISCLMPNRCWVSDMKKVQEIDKNGRTLKELDIYFTLFGSHTLTQSGDLLFLKDNDVFMLTSNGEVRNLLIHTSVHFCIHCSRMNDDILIGDINIVTRYDILGSKLDETNLDDEGEALYVETIFITENTNGDIIVSDNGKKAIVVTNKSGRHLFNYKGHHSQTTFHPGGICIDVFGHILVCNVSSDPSVHLLNQKGQFLTYLLTKHQHGSDCPQALCVDSQHNLYVGYSNKNRINVYSYLTNEQLRDLPTKEAEANTNLDLTEDTKKISLVDSHNVEKRSNESDSIPKTTPGSFSRPYAKKTDSEDTWPKLHDDLDITYASKQKKWSRNRIEESNVLSTEEILLYCDKMLDEENTDNSVSTPHIPPRKRFSQNVATHDFVWPKQRQTSTPTLKHPTDGNYDTKEMAPPIPPWKRFYKNVATPRHFDLDEFVWPTLWQTSTAILKHPMEEYYDMDEQCGVTQDQASTSTLKHPMEENYDTDEMDELVYASPDQTSTETLKHPTEENYNTTEMDEFVLPSLRQTSTSTLKHPMEQNYDMKDAFVRSFLRRTSTSTLKHPVKENYDTTEIDELVYASPDQTSTETLKHPTEENYNTREMDEFVLPSLRQKSTSTLKHPMEQNYDMKAPPIPPRKRVPKDVDIYGDNWRSLEETLTSILKDSTKEYYVITEMAPPIPPRKRVPKDAAIYGDNWRSLKETSTSVLKDPTKEYYVTTEMGPVTAVSLRVAEHKRRLKQQTGLELIEISSDDNYKIESEEKLNTIKVMERVTDDFLRFTYTKLNKIDSSKTCVEPWPPTTSVSADGYKLHYRFPRSTHLLDVVLHKDRGETIGPYIELLYELANHIDSFHSAGWIFRCLRAKNVWILETQKREQSIVVPKFGEYRMIVSSEFDAHPEQIKVDSRKEMEGVQWLSIEAIKAGVYSKESDVYAFGMVTWEVMTAFGQEGVVYDQDEERELSCTPFNYQQSENILQHLIEGYIPEKPVKCPDWFYQEVTRPCLLHQKIDRPSMKTVLQILQTRLGKTLPRQILSLPPSVPPELHDVHDDADILYEDDYKDWGVVYTSPNPSDDKKSIKPVEDDRANSPVVKRKPQTPPKINMEKKDSHADGDTHKGSDFDRSDNLGDTQTGSDIDRRVGAAKDKSIGDEPTSAIKTKPRVFPKPKAKPKSPFYVNDQELKADDVSIPVYVNQNQPGTKPVVPPRKPLNK